MRMFRRAICVLVLAATAGVAMAQTQAPAPIAAASPLAGLPDPYRVEDDWAKLPPGRIWGGVSAIAIDRDGKSVWMFERCENANESQPLNGCALHKDIDPVLKFDSRGNLVKSFGAGIFIYPHGIFVDRNNNIWLADRGGNTVREFSPDGKPLLTLGTPGVAGSGPYEFNGVSAVLVAPDGDIFVADGHGGKVNDRIVKYDSQGKFLMQWGQYGPGPNDFNPPHGLAMDREGRLYVADRSNKAVKVFDQNGKLLNVWNQFGEPSGVFVDKNDILYVADSTSTNDSSSHWFDPGFTPGIRLASVKDGKLIANIPWPVQDTIEGVAVDDAGNVYGGFTNVPGAHRFMQN